MELAAVRQCALTTYMQRTVLETANIAKKLSTFTLTSNCAYPSRRMFFKLLWKGRNLLGQLQDWTNDSPNK